MFSTTPDDLKQEHIQEIKLVLLGPPATGKSSLSLRFISDKFHNYSQSTIGASFSTRVLELEGERKVRINVWDTAGQEKYKSLAPMYYRGSSAAVLVYDITDKSSLDGVQMWYDDLLQHVREDEMQITVVGNKLDLDDLREISPHEGKMFVSSMAEAGGHTVWGGEISAKESPHEVITKVFSDLALRVPKLNDDADVDVDLDGRIDLASLDTGLSGRGCC